MSTLKRVLFVPDTHRPYHDKRAWAVLLAAGRKFRPDIVVTLGDFADFYSVSSHGKNPNRTNVLDVEIADVIEGLRELQALGAKRNIFVSGNHEDRLQRYLETHASALHNLVRIPDVLKLKQLGFEYVPYKDHVRLGKLYITHDAGKAGKYAHYDAQAAFESNVIIGHTHRLGYAVAGNATGHPHVGCMLGWLGDFDSIDYMHRVRALRDWAHGFGVGYLEPNGTVHIRPMPIVNGRVVLEGELISA